MKIKIIHYRDKCIGCNTCIEHSPSNWEIDDNDGKSNLIGSKETKKGIFMKEIFESEFQENQYASEDCPVKIIKIIKN